MARIIPIALMATIVVRVAFGHQPPIMQYSGKPAAALDFIATATNHWGVDASSASGVLEGVYGVLRFAIADCDQSAMCGLFRAWTESQIPMSADRNGTNTWLGVKCDGVRELIGSRAVCNDTNCWMAAASLHGQVVELDRPKWYEMLGLDAALIDERPDGSVVISAPVEKRAALGGRPWMTIGTNGVAYVNAPPGAGLEPHANEAAREFKARLGRFKNDVKRAFEEFALSETFTGMEAVARNTIVSNLVEAARFTPDEASALGLTNVVEAVSGK